MEDNAAVMVGVGRRYVASYMKCKNKGTIDPNHPLKEILLDCLKDRDVERPSAQQLCEDLVAALKEGPQYSESVRVVEARSTAEQDRDKELRSLRYQHSQQVQAFNRLFNHKQVNWQRRIKLSQGKSKI